MPVLGTERFQGIVGGRRTEVFPSSDGALIICVHLPEDFPTDLYARASTVGTRLRRRLGGQEVRLTEDDLDQALHVRGDDEDEVATILAYPSVVEALRSLFDDGLEFTVDQGVLVVRETLRSTTAFDHAMKRAQTLAESLSEQRSLWNDLSLEHQLSFRQSAGLKELSGTIFGEQVTVTNTRTEEGWSTRIRVEVGGLPHDVSLRPGRGDLGDPILDRFFVTSGDLRALQASPGFDLVRELLVEAHHIWPVVAVKAGCVELIESSGSQGRIEAMLEAAVTLAKALSRASRVAAEPRAP